MQNIRTFIAAMAAVVFVGYAGLFSTADADGVSDRPLAPPSGEVLVDGATLTGQLVRADGKTEVVFTAHNPTDQKIDMKSRMGAMPMQVAGQEVLLVADAGATVQKRVRLDVPEGAGTQKVPEDHSPEGWSLLVARSALSQDAIWGAEPPAPSEEAVDLQDRQVILASSSISSPDLG
jgi:hypothetical protein